MLTPEIRQTQRHTFVSPQSLTLQADTGLKTQLATTSGSYLQKFRSSELHRTFVDEKIIKKNNNGVKQNPVSLLPVCRKTQLWENKLTFSSIFFFFWPPLELLANNRTITWRESDHALEQLWWRYCFVKKNERKHLFLTKNIL